MRVLLLAAALVLAAAPQGLAAGFDLREQMMRPDAARGLRLPSQMPITRSEPRTYLLPAPAPETSPATTLTEQDRTAGLPVYPREFGSAPKPPANLLHIGPIQTEIVNGHTRYRIEGVSVMGGSVSGSLSGRGAKIFLRWRNN